MTSVNCSRPQCSLFNINMHILQSTSTTAVTAYTSEQLLSVSINHYTYCRGRWFHCFPFYLSSLFSFSYLSALPYSHYFCIWALLKLGGFIKKLVLSLYYRLDGVSGTDATVNNRKLGFKIRHQGIWCMVENDWVASKKEWQRSISKWKRWDKPAVCTSPFPVVFLLNLSGVFCLLVTLEGDLPFETELTHKCLISPFYFPLSGFKIGKITIFHSVWQDDLLTVSFLSACTRGLLS